MLKNIDISIIQIILLIFLHKLISRKYIIFIYESQQNKGLLKYKHSLNDCPKDKYNWTRMSIEELVDFFQYVRKNKVK